MIKFLLAIAFFIQVLNANEINNSCSFNVINKQVNDIQELKETFIKLKNNPNDIVLQKKYFMLFPKDFKQFMSYFGYSGEKDHYYGMYPDEVHVYAPLYEDYYDYLNLFFELIYIEKKCIYQKTIDIMINGQFQKEAVNIFVYTMRDFVTENQKTFINILSNRTDKEQKSFWYLYFDGPIPEKKLPKHLEDIKKLNENTYNIMVSALKQVQHDRGDVHEH